nr:glycosyltransferase [uncultured Methanobacterium sp.]
MPKIKVNMITSWDIKCGIADTTQLLVNYLNKYDDISVKVCPITRPESKNPFYFLGLLNKIKTNEITHIQYQPGLFGYFPVPHLNYNYIALVLFKLKFWKKNKIITTVHEIGTTTLIDGLILKILNLSDKIIVHDNSLIETLEENGFDSKKITKIPLGVHASNILDQQESKSLLGFPDKKIITIFGFVGENKGHDLVVDVMPRLDDDIILLVAGGARNQEQLKYYNFLKNKVKSMELEDRVIFLDFVKDEDIPKVSSATDLFIFPYIWIAASAALNQAITYRKPTLTSDLDYFKGIKNEFDCIELFENNNKEDLLNKITEILDNSDKRAYLTKQCGKYYEKSKWETVAQRTKDLYYEMLDI